MSRPVFVLDAKPAKLLWSAETIAPGSSYFSTGAPLAFGDKVMIGNGGGDYGARGYVTAFDQATGQQVWRFHIAPRQPERESSENNGGDPAMEAATKTWSGAYWKTGTGGTVGNTMIFDPELNRGYIGTGNGNPYDPAIRSPAVDGTGATTGSEWRTNLGAELVYSFAQQQGMRYGKSAETNPDANPRAGDERGLGHAAGRH